MIDQAREFTPSIVAIADESARRTVAAALPGCEVVDQLAAVVEPADVVVNGVVGFAGLDVTIETLRAGKRLALANKESLIAAGPVVQPLRSTPGAELVPVDSEHCALHQCLRSSFDSGREVSRLLLTASGGPFRGRLRRRAGRRHRRRRAGASDVEHGAEDHRRLQDPDEQGPRGHRGPRALRHPYDDIEVVVHPQSIIHSMVEFTDGSTIAQLSLPDMRLPIGYALGYPGQDRQPVRAHRLVDARLGSISRSRIERRSGVSTSPTRPDAPVGPHRRG